MPDALTAIVWLSIALVIASIWIYNQLVKDRNQVANAWSDIDVQLMRRYNLVPQLVSAVRAYAKHEQATLEAITELRTQSKNTSNLAIKAAAEDVIEAGIHRLVAVAEDYPNLKADENFRQLSADLVQIEDHLQYARRFYNGAVRILNTRVASFPHLIIATTFSFAAAEFFQADDEARKSVRFSFPMLAEEK